MSRPIIPKPTKQSSNKPVLANTATTASSRSTPRPKILAARTKMNYYRIILLGIATAYLMQKKTILDVIFPYGGPVLTKQVTFGSMDASSDLLQFKHGKTRRLTESNNGKKLLRGPETVIVNKDGSLYTLTEDAKLVQLTNQRRQGNNDNNLSIDIVADVRVVRQLGLGRPLGGKFTMDGKTLYIADAILGLTRVTNVHDNKATLEIVASTIMDRNGTISRLAYVDDVAIGPKTGKVYFSDATSIAPNRKGRDSWDTLFASKQDLLRGLSTGRILEFDPQSGKTKVLADTLAFANGIAVDKDESYAVFAETFGPALKKLYLKGPNAGTVETVIGSEHLVGYPDGVDCSWTTGLCYAVMPSAVVPIHKFVNAVHPVLSVFLRTLLMALPKALAPPVKRYGGVIEVNPTTNQYRYIQDPTGHDISFLTGVTEHDGKLYLGSLENDFIGIYSLT
jgi:sugar lactone lactonase YvrE